jgi:hypothetical protein
MDPHPTLPQDLWDQTPPAVRVYIETLEGQVQTLTSMIHTLQEQVRALQEQVTQPSRNSSRLPSSDPPPSLHAPHAPAVSAVVEGNRAISARRAPWCLWTKAMRWSSSNPTNVAAARPPYRETMPRRFVIK